MNAVTSPPGSSRAAKRGPVGVRGRIRSARNVLQSARSRSQAIRYHRPAQVMRWCGSARRGGTTASPGPGPAGRSLGLCAAGRSPGPCSVGKEQSKRSTSRAYTAEPRASRTPVSTVASGRAECRWTAVTWMASMRCRSRAGMTCRTVVSARAAASSMPAPAVVASCRATDGATAWSSSNSGGGSWVPASNRYPPSGPLTAAIG